MRVLSLKKSQNVWIVCLLMLVLCLVSMPIWGQTLFYAPRAAFADTVDTQPSAGAYSVTTRGLDSQGNAVSIGNAITVYVNDSPATSFNKGDVITDVTQSGVEGYRFSHFAIYQNNALINLDGELVVTDTFVDTMMSGSVLDIVGVYVKQYTLTVTVPQAFAGMGGFEVSRVVGEENIPVDMVGYTAVFDINEVVNITAVTNDYYSFSGFSGLFAGEKKSDTLATILINSNREIGLTFKPQTVSLSVTPEVIGSGKIEYGNTDVKLGDTLIIYFDPGAAYQIKSFTINGLNVTDLQGNGTFENNTVTLNITQEWLDAYGTEIHVSAESKLNDMLLMFILILGIAVPMLIILVVVMYVLNRREKIKIKGDIIKGNQEKLKNDPSKFIHDLQSGAIGGGTEKEIEEELKRRKGK